jgi:hypothetical protein
MIAPLLIAKMGVKYCVKSMKHWLLILPIILAACKPEPKISTYEVKSETAKVIAKSKNDSAPQVNGMNGNATMQAEVASFAEPKWGPIPNNWLASTPNPMRKGSWSISSADGLKAEIAVTVFPGDVGGDTANVNRWRGQLGLEKASEDQIKSEQRLITVGSLTGKIYHLRSSDGKKSTSAIILPKDNATWFFKLTGDGSVVESTEESFLQMVTQTQLP